MREEYTAYFTAIEQPASMLVGKEVPNPSGEGMLTLRDTASAREWQDATKYILVEEIKGRAVKSMDEQSDFLTTVHASIELFQKNSDLIPGTKDFDMDLADRVTKVLTPYILKVDDKIVGYNIPTQPLIDHAREQLIAERAAAPTPPPPAVGGTEQPGAASPPAAPPSTTPAAPQAGIPSKAGAGEQAEDFSTLFGTIGMPEFRI